ncbi:hypothetical protein KM043_002226 [Ampulex compressa]|nr:hypothetical protein KM043_002226 [Ampulex compressa]
MRAPRGPWNVGRNFSVFTCGSILPDAPGVSSVDSEEPRSGEILGAGAGGPFAILEIVFVASADKWFKLAAKQSYWEISPYIRASSARMARRCGSSSMAELNSCPEVGDEFQAPPRRIPRSALTKEKGETKLGGRETERGEEGEKEEEEEEEEEVERPANGIRVFGWKSLHRDVKWIVFGTDCSRPL